MKLNKKWMVGILSLSLLVMNFIPMSTLSENYGKANLVEFSSRDMPTDASPKALTPVLALVIYTMSLTLTYTMYGEKEQRNELNALNYFNRFDGIDASIEADMSDLD